MCCSSRQSGNKAYSYTPATSPWDRKFLLGIWISQLVFTVFVSVLGGALLPAKLRDSRSDDGISEAFYIILLLLVGSTTVLNVGFFILQYMWFRKNKLHPGWMLFITCFNSLIWLGVMGTGLWSIIGWTAEIGVQWQVYEGVELLYVFSAIPFMIHLAYNGVVYRRFRKNRRRSVDVEFQNRIPEEPHV